VDVARRTGIVVELFAQAADVDVQGLRRAEPVRVPDLVDQALAGDDRAGVLDQEPQQVELLAAELQLLAAKNRTPPGRIHPDVAQLGRSVGSLLPRMPSWAWSLTPHQYE
jgi:hypothetical protein